MALVGEILIQGMQALVVRVHVESCKECRKKYEEILKHAEQEYEKREAAKD